MMDMLVLFATLMFIWLIYSSDGNTFPSNALFDETVSPFKYLLDGNMIQTTYAKTQTKCATVCAITSRCESFIFIDGGFVDSRCYSQNTHDYAGTWNITYTGRACQRWDSQSPHIHLFTNINDFPDATLADAANYCRDPRNEGFLWCFSTDAGSRWEICDIAKCMGPIDNCRLFDSNNLPSQKYYTGFTYFKMRGSGFNNHKTKTVNPPPDTIKESTIHTPKRAHKRIGRDDKI